MKYFHESVILTLVVDGKERHLVDGKERHLNEADDSGGNTMTAFTNNSEMVLAIEGARGPPKNQKRNFFSRSFQMPLFTIKRGQK